MIRIILLVIMVLSFFAVCICDYLSQSWMTGTASILLGAALFLIFWPPKQ